jgi:dienelactone hydrolase
MGKGYLAYREFVALETQRENVTGADAEQYCNQTMNGYVEYGKKLIGGLHATPGEVLRSLTASLTDAVPARGKFPLLIYAPSFRKSSIQNHIACEYFASHGYIVASVASAGDTSQVITSDEQGVMAQVKDLESLGGFLRKRNATDLPAIGTFGFSWGGFSALIHQMRNAYVAAVAS